MSPKNRTKASRWLEVARVLRDELPGTWSVRGKGQALKIVREPVEWTLNAFSYASTYDDEGYLYSHVIPLVEPFVSWHLTYGIRIGDAPGTPGTVNLLADNALHVAREFILGPGLAEMSRWPSQELARWAELSLQANPEEVRDSPPDWLMAAGWRVVNGTGSPVEAVRRTMEFIAFDNRARRLEPRWGEAHVRFYEGLGSAWGSGGRERALSFMTECRSRWLSEQGVATIAS